MISAIIHVSNKNYDALTLDFIKLGFLPEDTDKQRVSYATEKIIGPYIKRGGGMEFLKDSYANAEVGDQSFQEITQEFLKA